MIYGLYTCHVENYHLEREVGVTGKGKVKVSGHTLPGRTQPELTVTADRRCIIIALSPVDRIRRRSWRVCSSVCACVCVSAQRAHTIVVNCVRVNQGCNKLS